MADSELYQAILQRRSVRRYQRAPLDSAARALDRALSWSLLSDGDLDCPGHLEPLARATLA